MKNLKYLKEPVPVKGSKLAIVAVNREGSAMAMEKRLISGREDADSAYMFPLMPFLIRKAEAQEEVPEYEDVQKAIQKAKIMTAG